MSLQQIVREFPFLRSFTSEDVAPLTGLWQDAVVQARVSRLSLDALGLTMENIPPRENFSLRRYLSIFDSHGRDVFHRENERDNFPTLGDALLYVFPSHDREWTEEVHYILYVTDRDTARIRHGHGFRKKAHRVYKTERRDMILFKMPKKITLWELLQRYRRQQRQR